ncbi:TPA: TNT domain-containing protein, partial [Listeria monocytogenes]|nr:TNT domain-containing protein [Listeria monocytogenes]
IIEGETAPWFDQKGGATQLYGITEDGTVLSVEQLIDEEYLELVN